MFDSRKHDLFITSAVLIIWLRRATAVHAPAGTSAADAASSPAAARQLRHRFRPRPDRATPAARAGASCCAAAGAGMCGSATACVNSSLQTRATPAPTAAPPMERSRTRWPMPRRRRPPLGRAPPSLGAPHRQWHLRRARATPAARAGASCCAAAGAGMSGSATASARSSLGRGSATGMQTAVPPQELSRAPRPLHLRRNHP